MCFPSVIVISQDTLLDLMQVSRSWSVQISSSAVLWVDIILKDEYDAAAKAALALHYSRQAPLALYMFHPTGWWDTLKEHIVANRARITKLIICRNGDRSFTVPILRQLSPLPSLATFDHSWLLPKARQDTLNCLLDSPIEWTSLLFDRGTLGEIIIRRLRQIHLDCELEDVFDLLEGSECLREVAVSRPKNHRARSDVKNLSLQGPPLPWKYLQYHSDRGSFLRAIFGRLSKLVELRIWVSQSTFCHLMPLMFQLENLSRLEVATRGKWDRFERLVIPRASTSVRVVTIELIDHISPVMEAVVDVFIQCLPNAEFLMLLVDSLPAIRILTSSTGFRCLNSLFINIKVQPGDTWSQSDGVLEPFAPSVDLVSYSIVGGCLEPLLPLQCHHIMHLLIRCLASEMDLDSRRWTAIRTINLRSNTTVNWKGPAYQHLYAICLETSYLDSESQTGRNGTQLCRDISLHPQYFPALSKLEFPTCPELDILFILIEGRNVSIKPGISPISILRLPTRCPPVLFERLRALVKGVNCGLSSYYELSIAGNYDIITDPSM
jgi:hypothetical protein